MNLGTIDERIKALEDGANEELIEILLELSRIMEEELGRNLKPLKRRIRALKRNHPKPGQNRLQQPKA